MGVMFDIKFVDYMQVINSRTGLSYRKDKEHRKRPQKEKSKCRNSSPSKKNRQYPCKSTNLLDLTV